VKACWTFAFWLCLLGASAPAQVLRSAELNGDLSRGQARQLIAAQFKAAESQPEPTCAVELYKVRYWSTGLKGERTLLSGLVALPVMSRPKGLVVFMHGTTVVRENVPSRVHYGGSECPEGLFAVAAFASGGYAMVAPDYIGQGDSAGPHPYMMGPINAASGIDLIKAAREFAASKKRSLGEKLFVTGYSEGGGNAMWLARNLMEGVEPSMQLTSAAPISGPYDLSGAQTQAMLASQTGLTDVAARLFFMADFAYSLFQCDGAPPLDQIFTPSVASYVPIVFGRDLATDELYVKQLGLKGLQLGTFRSVRRILADSFKTAIDKKDRTNAGVAALYANDCYDWKPSAPLYMAGLPGDNFVVFQNTRNALAAMRKQGAGKDMVNAYGYDRKGLNHLNGIAPLLALVRKFFDGGFSAVPTSD
jgi:pimeloyl-ACP methyl ester carboxylesterase